MAKITRAFVVIFTDENIDLIDTDTIRAALQDTIAAEGTFVVELPPGAYEPRL